MTPTLPDLLFTLTLVKKLRRLREVASPPDGFVTCVAFGEAFEVCTLIGAEADTLLRLTIAGQNHDLTRLAPQPSAVPRTPAQLLMLGPEDVKDLALGWIGPDESEVPDILMAKSWLKAACALAPAQYMSPSAPSDTPDGG